MVSNNGSGRLAFVATVLAAFSIGRLTEAAFVREPLSLPRWKPQMQRTGQLTPAPFASSRRMAGGFEWEDPAEAFDQAVDNPFKNTDVLVDPQDGMLKIDPARLLAPRMNGSNLYFIGMMGSGKSAVGKIVAKRKWIQDISSWPTMVQDRFLNAFARLCQVWEHTLFSTRTKSLKRLPE
jgi:hypothetical protein